MLRSHTTLPCDMQAESVLTTAAANLVTRRETTCQAWPYFSSLKLLQILDDSAFWTLGSLVEVFLFVRLDHKPVWRVKPGIVCTILQIPAVAGIKMRYDDFLSSEGKCVPSLCHVCILMSETVPPILCNGNMIKCAQGLDRCWLS